MGHPIRTFFTVAAKVAALMAMVAVLRFGDVPLNQAREGTAHRFTPQKAWIQDLRTLVAVSPQGRSKPESELAKGKFLVAGRNLKEPNFAETVVLLVDYSLSGATGVIINRPTQLTLSTVLPDIELLRKRTDTVFLGGPVATNQMAMLIRSRKRPDDSVRVFDEVYLSGSRKTLRQLIETGAPGQKFRFYAGYAGWGPAQLEGEMARGDWYVSGADARTIFDKPASNIWSDLIDRVEGQWASGSAAQRVSRPAQRIQRKNTGLLTG